MGLTGFNLARRRALEKKRQLEVEKPKVDVKTDEPVKQEIKETVVKSEETPEVTTVRRTSNSRKKTD